MRLTPLVLISAFLAAASWAPAALVHESTFDSASGTDPVAAGDVSRVWAVDGSWTGGVFGYYSYNGTGQLVLHHPVNNWDDPYMEYDTSGIASVTGDLEVELDCQPLFAANSTNQGVALMITDPATSATPASDQSNVAAAQAILVARRYNNVVRVAFSGNPSNLAGFASLDVPADSLTSLRLIVTYNSSLYRYNAFVQANGGDLRELAGVAYGARTKAVVNVTDLMVYTGETEQSYNVNLDNLKIFDAIQTTAGTPLPVQERTFSGMPGSSDYFYPITLGDLNQMYTGGSSSFDYNGLGQLVVGHAKENTGWPNAGIDFITPIGADVSQFVIDVKPGFTNDGVLQMFNLYFGNDLKINIANADGIGAGVGIFAWQSDIYALNPSDAAVVGVPAADIDSLRLVVSYFAVNHEMRLYWSVNGTPLHEHPNSPRTVTRTATSVEFQWQVWSASNPSPFTVGLDNFAEYDQRLYGEPPTAASPSWVFYN